MKICGEETKVKVMKVGVGVMKTRQGIRIFLLVFISGTSTNESIFSRFQSSLPLCSHSALISLTI